jgi:hypothetical protein
VIKIWGRNTSSNVQKVMWAVGEMSLPHERIDIGGPFGKNREAAYLAMNPNGLVPTLEEEDGFLLWESNSIVRYLAAKHKATVLEPADLRTRANASKWMDWQLSVAGPAITPVFLGADPHVAGKTRSRGDRVRNKEYHDRHDHDGRAAWENRVSCRRRVFVRRHSGRHHGLPLPATGAGTSAVEKFRALVRRDLVAAGVQGSGRVGAADVTLVIIREGG